MDKRELAMNYFLEGYNCAQAVVLAFHEEAGLDREQALRLASSFGGGMGRLREVCGAVSGMFIIAGCLYGYSDPKAYEEKAELYARIQELAASFREQYGSIVCRELLSPGTATTTPVPERRTEEYYKKRPCPEQIGEAAAILEQYIKEHA